LLDWASRRRSANLSADGPETQAAGQAGRRSEAAPATRYQIESGTRGVYVGARYAERSTNWPLFSWSPSEERIVRFDDKAEAEAELARVQSYAANARLREVDV
jgi:hypothetical protein